MAPGAGVFLTLVGAALVCGGLWTSYRYRLLAIGAVAATLATVMLAAQLAAPHGPPTRNQILWLFGSVVLEALLIPAVLRHAGRQDDRRRTLAILTVVAIHFMPMAPALGPIVAALGLACLINIGVAWYRPNVSSRLVWSIDGALKMIAGVALLSAARFAAFPLAA
ncbi:MAG: DUF6609 family protein [Steroidobacteraceae bacterium]